MNRLLELSSLSRLFAVGATCEGRIIIVFDFLLEMTIERQFPVPYAISLDNLAMSQTLVIHVNTNDTHHPYNFDCLARASSTSPTAT